MQLRQLLESTDSSDDRAVSPVIGVILMVAITVILAAIIGTFVLGLGEQVQSSGPQAGFGTDYSPGTTGADCSLGGDGQLEISHESGETIDPVNLNVTDGSASKPWDGGDDGTCAATTADVTAGSSMAVDVDSDDSVRLVWVSESGDESATLTEWDGPDA
ncbi:type IV pilin [Natronomonas marina]|uniref:type IV pilin n=1 Tax=Natronomonas marina TaxID=2961939 RepID=UPI0020C9E30B|nr:type IV pilin N-terminal domain-containing protein [Natronomonas marina]